MRNSYTQRRGASRRDDGTKGEKGLRRLFRFFFTRKKEKAVDVSPRKSKGAVSSSPPLVASSLKYIGGLILLLSLAGGVLFGLFRFSLWLYGEATTSEFFVTKHIDIAGNVRLTRDMVLEYAGVKEGDNCLAVSIGEVERKLRATPWVAEVSVKRFLPDRFVIRLKERLPSFWVRKDNTLFYANERGEPIAPVESDNFLSLPTLHIEPEAEAALPYLATLMMDMKHGGLPIEASAIASVEVSSAKGIEVYLEDRELRLSIATDDWLGNITRLGVTLSDLARRRELRFVREVRASQNSVWVILNQATK